MRFFAIRYFVIKTSNLLFEESPVSHPREYFTLPIIKNQEINYYNKSYTFRTINKSNSDKFLIGYMLKSADTNLIKLDEELFNEEEINNWEKLFFAIDIEKQIFIGEINPTVAAPDNVKNVLSKMANILSLRNGYEIILEFIVDKHKFWEVINNSNGIYQIAFKLNSPNLFGGTKRANEWIKILKDKHNMTNFSVDFRNENANLEYDEEELESYRDYADSGGGTWTLGVIKEGSKKKFHSYDNIRTKEDEIITNDPKSVLSNLDSITERVKEIFKSLD